MKFKPPEFYNIEILKSRGKGKKKEFLVHYVGGPNTYDEWKKAKDLNQLRFILHVHWYIYEFIMMKTKHILLHPIKCIFYQMNE